MKIVLVLLLGVLTVSGRVTETRLAPEASVWFEPNHGQIGGRTEWTARAAGAWLFLTSNEVVYALPPEIHFDPEKTRGVPTAKTTNVHMRIVGGRRVKGVGEKALGGYSNYFLGKHEDEWFTGVPHFGQVRYADVYPGIDVVYYAVGRNIEYDFIVKPGADPSAIELSFDGNVQLDETGNVVIAIGKKSFRQHRPRVFQGASEIEASYRITEKGTVTIDVGSYDPLLSLRVDPILDFSTYLGGPGADYILRMAVAADGNLVVAGATQSPAAPTLDPFQQPSVVSLAPILFKMSPDGRRMLWHTILGRNGWDIASVLALDKDGSVVTGGSTRSPNFPLKNPIQTELKAIFSNAWLARLSADGRTLVYSTYLGGSNTDNVRALTLDPAGNAYYGGSSESADFPLRSPLQSRREGVSDGVLVKISPDAKLLFSSYLGGSAGETIADIKWRKDGVVVFAGSTSSADFPLRDPIQATASPRPGWPTAFLATISQDGSSLLYSTYIGGNTASWVSGLALGPDEKIYATGFVGERGFPLKNPLFTEAEGFHSFVSVFDRTGRERISSTLIPGVEALAIEVAEDGGIILGGSATSPEVPLKDSLQPYIGGGISRTDGFVMKLGADGRALHFSTLMGGSNSEFSGNLALGPGKVIYAAGSTVSTNFPVKSAYQSEPGGGGDAYLYRITDNSIAPVVTVPFAVSPSRLVFRYTQGATPPPPSPIAISGLTGQLLATVTVPWMKAAPAALGVSGTITVITDPIGLPPGVHQGGIRLTSNLGDPVIVDVVLTILATAPILSAVEPALVPIGADDTEITLRGSGFTNKTTVQLQTVPWQLSPVRFLDPTTIKFILPKTYFSAEYNHSITVQNPDSAVSKPVSLAVGRPAPFIAAKGIVSAASYAGDVVSPGEILTLFGENFEQGMRVNFDGLLATPLYITPGQLSVVAPTGLAGAREVNVIVEMNFDWRSIPVRMPVWPARPGLFTAKSSGNGQAAALNQDGSVNSPANPAVKGSIAVLYGTGGGVENLPTKVFIDGIECEVLYAGQAPGLIAGAWQLNVRIPEFASKGEVVWRAGERESVEGVVLALKEN